MADSDRDLDRCALHSTNPGSEKNRYCTIDRVAIFIPGLDMGGGARTAINVASGLAGCGYPVDLIVLESGDRFESECPETVRVVRLTQSFIISLVARCLPPITGLKAAMMTAGKIPSMVRYLRRERPVVLATFAGSTVAVLAVKISRIRCRIAVSAQVVLSAIINRRSRLRAAAQLFLTRCYISGADVIIAASRGVADDIIGLTAVPSDRVKVIYNPVVTDSFQDKADAVVEHPWFAQGEGPVVLAVAQFKPQKDLATLVRAFAIVRSKVRANLLILGEGGERASLAALVRELGLSDCVEMPGYDSNPYKFMRRASVFVLSSLYEGFGNVLAEALAVGTPVVSTDCESGPAEILVHGRFGRLVPVGNAEALALAILETLEAPPDSKSLRMRGRDFSLDTILPKYLHALGLPPISGIV